MSSSTWHRQRVRESRGWLASLLRGLLWLASLPYGWIVGRRNARFDAGRRPVEQVSVPVLSVGNLTVGGTGKTPLVAWLARELAQQGRRVALVSRGYGAATGQPNDEALELADKLPRIPHVQDRDRVAGARLALSTHQVDVIILDDAFQHRRLHRDLDIVLLDALDPFGGDCLLPRGLLREPVTGLRRADVVVLTRSDCVSAEERVRIRERVERLAPRALWLESALCVGPLLQRGESAGESRQVGSQVLRGYRVAAFCAIGNPAGFRHTLQAAGTEIVGWREFPDHHRYTERDLRHLDEWASQLAPLDAVLCTHKDWVKISRSQLGAVPLYALTVDLTWRVGETELIAKLNEILVAAGGRPWKRSS